MSSVLPAVETYSSSKMTPSRTETERTGRRERSKSSGYPTNVEIRRHWVKRGQRVEKDPTLKSKKIPE